MTRHTNNTKSTRNKNQIQRIIEEIEKVFEENPIHQTAHFDSQQTSFIHNNSFNQKPFLEKKLGNNKTSRKVEEQTEMAQIDK